MGCRMGREPVDAVDLLASVGGLPCIGGAVVLEQLVQKAEHVTIAGCGLPAVDPCEDNRCCGAVSAVGLFLPADLLDELPELLVHDVEIVVGVVRPEVKVCQLDRDVYSLICAQGCDDVLIGVHLVCHGLEEG